MKKCENCSNDAHFYLKIGKLADNGTTSRFYYNIPVCGNDCASELLDQHVKWSIIDQANQQSKPVDDPFDQ